MKLPDLILVRHGESHGNVINARLRGDASEVPPAGFHDTHNSAWELTEAGTQQAVLAGEWIRSHANESPHLGFVSVFTRTLQTAECLALPDTQWHQELLLREREVSNIAHQPSGKPDPVGELDYLYLAPLGVDTFAQLSDRVQLFMTKLRCLQLDPTRPIVIVTHSKTMWAFRFVLENMTPQQFVATFPPPDKSHEIGYGHILHYSGSDELGLSFEKFEHVSVGQ
ncbi:phosphoglycerate mutase family protein [Candidatus Saccharibacteria bacterium]|nr:phosphoglycerate mutase family protein [Candidatus Saccharibacteria bacterium]